MIFVTILKCIESRHSSPNDSLMVFPGEDILTSKSAALASAVARFLFGKSGFSPTSSSVYPSSASTALSSFSLSPHSCAKISSFSRLLGLDRVFHLRLLHVLDLAYKVESCSLTVTHYNAICLQ